MGKWEYNTAGVPDDLFVRGNVPMTKEEIRAVVIAKLRLKPGQIVFDIGAGTGSISIEAAFQVGEGIVYAVERKEEALNLIKENAANFGLNNIEFVPGEASQVLASLPAPDRVIVGGSGGNLQEILKIINKKLKNRGRIVITAVTTNTLNQAIASLEALQYQLNICHIAVTRTKKIADYHMFAALNPVYIITAAKEETI
ncbi:precorrin-6Y C5,15-methyltransferase (decarboxylating) subunit CbiT [Halocella sp. SP3-1]|uniref:precorrin-6Y C5,15-methyltransferase (decarboxylating) subunit CbiT n=1 Tax=Halocella sp. SP3-1 TaxID=2382161 RepID=UPI000F759F26|nr:precorrin-6Y C5,15-methyltransferase (decarboxylating) subunit CbiT [Halocella sp. SP3-1]AZO95929.1 precorrin-6Y C5,15-methyltransferase (decarboxylating) subunit CbiT [Halocella sp. SP3-1]